MTRRTIVSQGTRRQRECSGSWEKVNDRTLCLASNYHSRKKSSEYSNCYCKKSPIVPSNDPLSSDSRPQISSDASSFVVQARNKRIRNVRKISRVLANKTVVPVVAKQTPQKKTVEITPASPMLSPETERVLEDARQIAEDAYRKIGEIKFMSKPPRVAKAFVEYPQEVPLDDETDELLYVREVVTTRFDESNEPESTTNSKPRRNLSRTRFSNTKVDYSASKFKTVEQRLRETVTGAEGHQDAHKVNFRQTRLLSNEFPHDVNSRVHWEDEVSAKPADSRTSEERVEDARKIAGLKIQAGPPVSIDRKLKVQRIENVHILPNPSFQQEDKNVGRYDLVHGGSMEVVNNPTKEIIHREQDKIIVQKVDDEHEATTTEINKITTLATVEDNKNADNVADSANEKYSESSKLVTTDVEQRQLNILDNAEVYSNPPVAENQNDKEIATSNDQERNKDSHTVDKPADDYSAKKTTECVQMVNTEDQKKSEDSLQRTKKRAAIIAKTKDVNRKRKEQLEMVERRFQNILKKYNIETVNKAASNDNGERTLNMDSSEDSVSCDLEKINLREPNFTELDAVLSTCNKMIEDIARGTEEVANFLRQRGLAKFEEPENAGISTDDEDLKIFRKAASRDRKEKEYIDIDSVEATMKSKLNVDSRILQKRVNDRGDVVTFSLQATSQTDALIGNFKLNNGNSFNVNEHNGKSRLTLREWVQEAQATVGIFAKPSFRRILDVEEPNPAIGPSNDQFNSGELEEEFTLLSHISRRRSSDSSKSLDPTNSAQKDSARSASTLDMRVDPPENVLNCLKTNLSNKQELVENVHTRVNSPRGSSDKSTDEKKIEFEGIYGKYQSRTNSSPGSAKIVSNGRSEDPSKDRISEASSNNEKGEHSLRIEPVQNYSHEKNVSRTEKNHEDEKIIGTKGTDSTLDKVSTNPDEFIIPLATNINLNHKLSNDARDEINCEIIISNERDSKLDKDSSIRGESANGEQSNADNCKVKVAKSSSTIDHFIETNDEPLDKDNVSKISIQCIIKSHAENNSITTVKETKDQNHGEIIAREIANVSGKISTDIERKNIGSEFPIGPINISNSNANLNDPVVSSSSSSYSIHRAKKYNSPGSNSRGHVNGNKMESATSGALCSSSSADSLKDCPSIQSISYAKNPRATSSRNETAQESIGTFDSSAVLKESERRKENNQEDTMVSDEKNCARAKGSTGAVILENSSLAPSSTIPRNSNLLEALFRASLTADTDSKSLQGLRSRSNSTEKEINATESSSTISHSEGELYFPTSGSYSLGEIRLIGGDNFVENEETESKDRRIVFLARDHNLSPLNKFRNSSTPSLGEIRGENTSSLKSSDVSIH